MHSASRALHSAQHQSTPAIAHGHAEKRSGYSDNSTARTVYCRATKTTIGDPEGIAPLGPRSRTFAPCRVLLPRLVKAPNITLSPTGANLARPFTTPPLPVRRYYKNPRRRLAHGSRPPLTQSLFWLSGSSITPRPQIEAT
jgi:hypothetical protein